MRTGWVPGSAVVRDADSALPLTILGVMKPRPLGPLMAPAMTVRLMD